MPSITADANFVSLKSEALRQLADIHGDPCISIIFPTHRKGQQTRQDPIRLKNLISKAAKTLEEHGHDDQLLRRLDDFFTDEQFWQHLGNGLAIYVSEGNLYLLRLNHNVDEYVHVGDSFLISPLVREHNARGECFVVTLSWDEAALHRFDGHSLTMVETGSLPAKFNELVLARDPEVSLQNTSHRTLGNVGGSTTAMFHGQGEGEDKIEADRRQYLSLVGDEVAGAIYNTNLPLLLVATTEVAGHFESASQVPPDATVNGSPSQLTESQLLDQIRQRFRSIVGADDDDFEERFGAATAKGSASNDPDEVARAAEQGRVATLAFCEDGVPTDALNTIVLDTVRQGGDVFRCEAECLSNGKTIAAIFRF